MSLNATLVACGFVLVFLGLGIGKLGYSALGAVLLVLVVAETWTTKRSGN